MTEQLSLRQIMNRAYKDLCGFEIPKTDSLTIKKSKGSPVYGEIKQAALDKLLSYLNLSTKDVFYDLGSGVGKVIMQTALSTPAKKIVGVELSHSRHHEAEIALSRLIAHDPSLKTKVMLLNKDLMTVDLSDATVIYSCSTAFSIKFMAEIVKRLLTFPQTFRLVSLQELPEENDFELEDILRLDMSWLRSTPVHIYKRT